MYILYSQHLEKLLRASGPTRSASPLNHVQLAIASLAPPALPDGPGPSSSRCSWAQSAGMQLPTIHSLECSLVTHFVLPPREAKDHDIQLLYICSILYINIYDVLEDVYMHEHRCFKAFGCDFMASKTGPSSTCRGG